MLFLMALKIGFDQPSPQLTGGRFGDIPRDVAVSSFRAATSSVGSVTVIRVVSATRETYASSTGPAPQPGVPDPRASASALRTPGSSGPRKWGSGRNAASRAALPAARTSRAPP